MCAWLLLLYLVLGMTVMLAARWTVANLGLGAQPIAGVGVGIHELCCLGSYCLIDDLAGDDWTFLLSRCWVLYMGLPLAPGNPLLLPFG